MSVRTVHLPVEPLTPEAFAPYGVVLGTRPQPGLVVDLPEFHVDAWIHGTLDMSGGEVELQIFTMEIRQMEFSFLERHMLETQAFMPLGGVPCVFPVAAPTGGDGPGHCPEPETVRAFLFDGTAGVQLHKGTWHWIPMPVGRPGTYLNMTRAGKFSDVVEGSEKGASQGDFQRRDLAELRGVRFRFEL